MQVLNAQNLLTDSHSVESIRAALRSRIPPEIQRQAQQFDDQLLRSGKISDQAVYVVTDTSYERTNRILGSLLRAIRIDPATWSLRVLDTNPKTENAFVVGGQYIYVFTGLIENAQSDDELAVILGHEMSHSLLKHNLRRSADFTHLLGSIAEIAGTFSRSESRRDRLGLVGGSIKALYSREDEQEADALGAYIVQRAGYDPARGFAFFNRMIKLEKAMKARNQRDMAMARQQVEQQVANCEQLRAQWNASPQVRTQQNAQIVNNTCQNAQVNVERYNKFVREHSKDEMKLVLLRTHPLDQSRISALAASTDYLQGRRPLSSLSGIGQGYKVFMAMQPPPAPKVVPQEGQVSEAERK